MFSNILDSLVVEAKNHDAPGKNSNTSIFGTIGSGILSSIPKKKPHAQHFGDFFPVKKQNGRHTPLLKISKCNVKPKHLDPLHPI